MSRYAPSKFRMFLIVCLMATVCYLASGTTLLAQTPPAAGTPAAAGEATKMPDGLIGIILSNIDFVFVVIMLCSMAGLTLIIQGFIKTRETVYMPPEAINQMRDMIGQRKFKELIEYTETEPSFISKALNPALKRAPSFSSMKEAMETAVGEQTADAFRRIEYLNIIGNMGPLLGLLGTVLGMIEAFSDMAKAGGNASPAQLAGGISKALAHTFMGLFLAVPCLACFGILRTLVDRLTVRSALVAEELLLMIKPAEAKTAATNAIAGKGSTPQPAAPVIAAPSPRKAPAPAPSNG